MTVIAVSILCICGQYSSEQEISASRVDVKNSEWIYYMAKNAQCSVEQIDGSVWRIHIETEEKECLWKDWCYNFLAVDDVVYIQCHDGLYKVSVDDKSSEMIYSGRLTGSEMSYQDGWLYFGEIIEGGVAYKRRSVSEGIVEELFEGSAFFPYSDTVVCDRYLYTLAREVEWEGGQISFERYGMLTYDLETGEQYVCMELMDEMSEEEKDSVYTLALAGCGDQLVVMCRDAQFDIVGIYATEMDERITGKTRWREVRFPDMQKENSMPPHSWNYSSAGRRYEYTASYRYHDGQVFYLNEDYNLCSRPLFGRKKDVVVYDGTTLAVDQQGRTVLYSGEIFFSGGDTFCYRYCSKINEEDAMRNQSALFYEPSPWEWTNYVVREKAGGQGRRK